MSRTVEAVVEGDGSVRPLGDVRLPVGARALVTILDDDEAQDTTSLSERALAEDWDRDEEDAAWAHLQ